MTDDIKPTIRKLMQIINENIDPDASIKIVKLTHSKGDDDE